MRSHFHETRACNRPPHRGRKQRAVVRQGEGEGVQGHKVFWVVLVVLERQLHHRAGFLNVPRPHLSRWPKHGHVTGCVLPPHNKQGGRRVVFPAVECSARTTVLNHPVLFLFFPSSGKKLGFTIDNGKLHNVSLGQGQEVVAEDALDVAAEKGHWVILQVRALCYHGHVTGDGTEPPIAGAPSLWLSSTEPLQTPSYSS